MFVPDNKPHVAPKGLQTEYEFRLPRGYVDGEGNLHRDGTMRMGTAMDEIIPMRDMRVKQNQAYLTVVLLSRVVTRLGTLPQVHTGVIESLFSADFADVQVLYSRINETDQVAIHETCHHW